MSAPIRLSDERGTAIQTNGVGKPYAGHMNLTKTMARVWGDEYLEAITRAMQKKQASLPGRTRRGKIAFAGYDRSDRVMS